MRFFINSLKIIVFLFLIFLGALFAIENNGDLTVDFFFFEGPNLTSGVWLTIFLMIGAILGICASFFSKLVSKEKFVSKKIKEH